jgi:pentatricopeptide repeat protein
VEAVSAFITMLRCGARPDAFTLPLLNRASAPLTSLVGAAHCFGIRVGFGGNVYFGNTLLKAYAQHGMVAAARLVFDEMRARDVVSWTTLVSAYVNAEDIWEVSRLLTAMRTHGRCEPSAVTLSVVFRLCTALRDTASGKQLQCYAVKRGWAGDFLVLNSMLTHMSRTSSWGDAEMLFKQSPSRDMVSWNIIISEYSSEGNVSKVISLYVAMIEEEVCPSSETLTAVVSVFARHKFLPHGKKLHSFAIRSGLMDTILVASFVDLYAKCGELVSSIQLFEEFNGGSKYLWSAMIWAFIYHGMFLDAIHLFERMMGSFYFPNADILRGLLVSYTEIDALRCGKATHGYIIRNNYAAESESCALDTALVKLYARCGDIHLAERCFSRTLQKDIVSWSSMIEAFTIHGHGKQALTLFNQMLKEGVKPNEVTFLSLLSACSHSGLVSEARELFDCMTKKFRFAPELGHYTCMVDVLGRSGNLEEALQVISNMKVKADGRIWGALLGSCRIHSNSKLAYFAAQKLVELEPSNVGYHVLLSNIQAGGDRWAEVEDIRSSMEVMNMEKSPAWSCISDIGVP